MRLQGRKLQRRHVRKGDVGVQGGVVMLRREALQVVGEHAVHRFVCNEREHRGYVVVGGVGLAKVPKKLIPRTARLVVHGAVFAPRAVRVLHEPVRLCEVVHYRALGLKRLQRELQVVIAGGWGRVK